MLPGIFVFLVKTFCLQLYPAYASYKAIKNNNTVQLTPWLMYWIVMSVFFVVEYVADLFDPLLQRHQGPLHPVAHPTTNSGTYRWSSFLCIILSINSILFGPFDWYLYCLPRLPSTQGSVILYKQFIHPTLIQHEAKIDEALLDAQDQAKKTGVELGKRGFLALQQAAVDGLVKVHSSIPKGQSLITEQITQQNLDTNAATGAAPINSSSRIREINSVTELDTTSGPSTTNPATTTYFGINPLSLLSAAVTAVASGAASSSHGISASQPSSREDLRARRARLEHELAQLAQLAQLDDSEWRAVGEAAGATISRTKGIMGPRARKVGSRNEGMVMVDGHGAEDREVDEIEVVDESEIGPGAQGGGTGWGSYFGWGAGAGAGTTKQTKKV
ncbi:hypothetical protein BC936DRAFT_150021 [Jimgerdemannia flammicorona]|uniref:Protein YOP1 n=1 Tax=Jimgerdemannia flammicorona TaxID=994334 RepID=A0A433CZR2_9FUNG|nr:hypothetical protein BC936DRAFT_150021 [Jimgerdemannia flammicorona]